MLHIYIAGPEVFLPGGRDLIARKGDLCREFGFEPNSLHADFADLARFEPHARGVEISRLNEALMNASDACIATLTPFRGVSADVGTVYEVGYMIAQGKPVFGFSNDPRDYLDRVRDDFYGETATLDDGRPGGPDGTVIENNGMSDNLMMEGGMANRGFEFVRAAHEVTERWHDLTAFTRCLEIAREKLSPANH